MPWKSCASDYRYRIFRRIFKRCKIGHFPTILLISLKKADQICMKILPQMCLWARKSTLSFGSHPDPPWQRYSLLECSCVGDDSTGSQYAAKQRHIVTDSINGAVDCGVISGILSSNNHLLDCHFHVVVNDLHFMFL